MSTPTPRTVTLAGWTYSYDDYGLSYFQIGSSAAVQFYHHGNNTAGAATLSIQIANEVIIGGVTYPVTAIGVDGSLAVGIGTANADRDNLKLITSVYVPPNVTTLGERAFSKMAALTTITGMTGVLAMDNFVFYQSPNLTSVTFTAVPGAGEFGTNSFGAAGLFRDGSIDPSTFTINLAFDQPSSAVPTLFSTGYQGAVTYTVNVPAARVADYTAAFASKSNVIVGTYAPPSGGGGGGAGGGVPCFPAGTKILTAGGYKAVEKLAAEDHIVTADGRAVPFKLYATRIVKATKETAPYAIKAGAFGRAGPSADIKLSPLHAIQSAKGVWQIPKYAAAMNAGVQQYGVGESVTYYHVELPNFFTDNIVAEGGAVVESYGAKQCAGMKNVYKYNATLGGFTRATKSASKTESK